MSLERKRLECADERGGHSYYVRYPGRGRKMGGRVWVGWVGREKFKKKIKGHQHFYEKLDAIGIDAQLFKDVLVDETTDLYVLDEDTGIIYCIRTAQFNLLKKWLHHKPHRAQVLVPRKHWKFTHRDPTQQGLCQELRDHYDGK